MSMKTPTVSVCGREGPGARVLYDPERDGSISLDTTAWWEWLEAPRTRRFAYPVYDPAAGYIEGFMTVRKERRERGGWYWSVYRRHAGRLVRVYLGRSANLTQSRLEEIAQTFWSVRSVDDMDRRQ